MESNMDNYIKINSKKQGSHYPKELNAAPLAENKTENNKLTLNSRKTFRAKLVDLSTFWAVPGCPSLKNLEPYCIALHILSLASALFKYNTIRESSALVASNVSSYMSMPITPVKQSYSIAHFN